MYENPNYRASLPYVGLEQINKESTHLTWLSLYFRFLQQTPQENTSRCRDCDGFSNDGVTAVTAPYRGDGQESGRWVAGLVAFVGFTRLV